MRDKQLIKILGQIYSMLNRLEKLHADMDPKIKEELLEMKEELESTGYWTET